MIDEKKLIEEFENHCIDWKSNSIGCIIRSVTNQLIDIVKRQPRLNEWIPVKERLPSSDGRFEVTIKGKRGKRHVEICNFHKDARYTPWGVESWEYGNVIAWRQRPEPYKEEKNESGRNY